MKVRSCAAIFLLVGVALLMDYRVLDPPSEKSVQTAQPRKAPAQLSESSIHEILAKYSKMCSDLEECFPKMHLGLKNLASPFLVAVGVRGLKCFGCSTRACAG